MTLYVTKWDFVRHIRLDNIKNMFKKVFISIIISVLLLLGLSQKASAQALDYQCTGKSLADYMNTVIDGVNGFFGVGGLSNVRLLSPAFNMTSSTFDEIVNGMADNGARFNDLDGIAGNVYNYSGYGMTKWLTEKLANGYIKGKDVYLTEAGDKDVADGATVGFDNLAKEISLLRGNSGGWNVKAALLFNAFNTNSNFSTFSLNDSEIRQVCGGNCEFVGVNTAVGFPISQSNTDKASGFKMQYALAIANRGDAKAVIDTINYAASKGITIIVRVGVGDNSGGFDDPGDYVDFLKEVNGQVNTIFYAIAGPNEPDSEFWASKDCKKNAQSPLENGFTPLRYACTATADPEFHPLRPYPASACDPLIPKSIPQASSATDNRFITYSCGSSLAPRIDEAFNAYGENGFYEGLSGPDGYTHTTCEKNGDQVTCYRSEKMDVTLNLRDSNVGVLGNTQDPNLTDEEKVNNYLSWYLTGTPQIGDQIPLNENNPNDINRLINFSGPLRKLLPYDMLATARDTVVTSRGKDVHNYMVGCNQVININPGDYLNALIKILTSLSISVLDANRIAAKLTLVGIQNLPAFGQAMLETANQPDLQFSDFWKAYLRFATNPEVQDRVHEAWTFIFTEFGNIYNQIALALASVQPIAPNRAVACADANIATAKIRLSYYDGLLGWLRKLEKTDAFTKLLQNIPLSSLEDIAGEIVMSVFQPGSGGDGQDAEVVGPVNNTAPTKLIIKSAQVAQ